MNIAEKKETTVPEVTAPHIYYKSYDEFCTRINALKLHEWKILPGKEFTQIWKNDNKHSIPLFNIYVEENLRFTIRVFNWCITNDHKIYNQNRRSLKNITLSNLISTITNYVVCTGITNSQIINSESLAKHFVPKDFDPSFEQQNPLQQSEYYRPSDCEVLTNTKQCNICVKQENKLLKQNNKKLKRKSETMVIPAKLNAPISLTSPERLKLTMQNYRIENKTLKAEIQQLQKEISKSSLPINAELNDDFISIIQNTDQSKIPPFMKFFWEEQQKYISSSKTGIRYHPMIIRYCLGLASKSASVYDDIRYDEKSGTGIVILPSRRRLRDYKNYIHPHRGFNPSIIQELKNKVKQFSEIEKFVVLLFDEMKIQENLVWDKHTGELVGFVDLGDTELNYATLQKSDALATHVLVFLLRSIVNPFKFSLANFATTGATSYQMYPLFWKAVGICELQCGIKVIATTCDGASTNRKFFRMHFHMTSEEDQNPDVDVTYRTRNLFSPDRFIYFISDSPHIQKTARNCLSNSGSGRCTRYMWNGGAFLIWNHIADLFYEDRECGLHLLPKLTFDHIKLTPFSVMNMKLAVQVLKGN